MEKLQSCHTTFGETSHPNVIVTALEILEPLLVSQETLWEDLKWENAFYLIKAIPFLGYLIIWMQPNKPIRV